MRIRLALVTATLCAVTGCVSAPTTPSDPNATWSMTGTVSTMALVPIGGAVLTVTDGANKSAHVTTDQTGGYTLGGLQSGRFSLTVAAPGYVTATPTVDLYANIGVNFALQAAK